MPSSADRAPATRVPTIIVHGGAGANPAEAGDFRQGVRDAALGGWRVLAGDGAARDAVESAVRAREDDPRFNAGRGAVLHRPGAAAADGAVVAGERRPR